MIAAGKTIETLLGILRASLDTSPAKVGSTCRIIANMLVSSNHEIMMKFLTHDLLTLFDVVLAKANPYFSTEALWGLSNIACHSQEAIEHLVNHKVFNTIQIHLASTNMSLRREAIHAVSNVLTVWDPLKVYGLLGNDPSLLRQYLKSLLLVSHQGILLLIMDTIEYFGQTDGDLGLRGEASFMYLVEINGGYDHLEELQKQPNQQVYDRAVQVLTNYVEIESETTLLNPS